MIEKLKENLHFIVLVNLILTLFVLIIGPKNNDINFVSVNGKGSEFPEQELREVICRQAFMTWKDGRLSDYYMHPDIIKSIQKSTSPTFKLENIEKFYFKMDGREICQVVAKSKEGFLAFEAVISKNGPIMYRLTSLRPKKPTYSEIKEYL